MANLPPEIGYLFIGGNDPWDAEKDMALAGIGAFLTMFILYFVHTEVGNKFCKKIQLGLGRGS